MTDLTGQLRAALWWLVPLVVLALVIGWETGWGNAFVRHPPAAEPMAPAVSAVNINWWGLARPSGRTDTASPPQISLAPLWPKWRQRRRVKSLGWPSVVPSHPSMGRIAKRLPMRAPS